MTDQNNFIEETTNQSFQKRSDDELNTRGNPLIARMLAGNDLIAPWWSFTRDRQLRDFVIQNDFLSGALYNMVAKMTAIPWSIVPVSYANPDYVEAASRWQEHLYNAPEFGDGWVTWYSLWLADLLNTDNGAFAEITGAGNPDGPIRGMPGTVHHLDSSRAVRTGNPKYPVLYTDTDGKLYRLHYTRVMFDSQLPSTDIWMNKVGLCAISRTLNNAQAMLDILIYMQEKLGSRPTRSILITQGGLDPIDVKTAFEQGNLSMDARSLKRYSMSIVLGSGTQPDADMRMIDLASLPDGFNMQESISIGMATIALAFGVDARELFPATQSGATRADALLQHIKQRGKGPGQIIQATERNFSRKFLPPYLKMVFEFQDDTQDRQAAEIHKIRSESRFRNLDTGVTNMRTEREQMLDEGEIDQSQFVRLELEDGRLEDGTSVLSLFFSDSENLGSFLDIGVDNPIDTENNDPAAMIAKINTKLADVSRVLANSKSIKKRTTARQAGAALKELHNLYMGHEAVEDRIDAPPPRSYPIRRENLTEPNQPTEISPDDTLRPGKDDKEAGSDRHPKV